MAATRDAMGRVRDAVCFALVAHVGWHPSAALTARLGVRTVLSVVLCPVGGRCRHAVDIVAARRDGGRKKN